MKKLVSGLIAALLVAAGIVAFSGGGAANAAAGPYVDTVPTYTHIHAASRVQRGHTLPICINVSSNGNGSPAHGHVTVRVNRGNGGYKWVRTHRYNGGRECFRTTKLHKRGAYTIKATYNRGQRSVYKSSSNRDSFRVTRRG